MWLHSPDLRPAENTATQGLHNRRNLRRLKKWRPKQTWTGEMDTRKSSKTSSTETKRYDWKSSIANKEAKKALAPFLRRIKRHTTQKLISQSGEDHQKLQLKSKVKDVIAKLQSYCQGSLEIPSVLHETAEILKDVTQSLGMSSYLVDETNEYLILNPKYMPQNGRHSVTYKIEPGQTVAAFVAYSQEFVIADDILGDSRFPLGIPGAGKSTKAVLCVPILTAADSKCIAVIELYRDVNQDPYSSADLQICISMAGWMGAAISQNTERLFLLKQSELTKYLMSLVEVFLAEEIHFDKFVSDIVECAKMSVQAERGFFYLLDEEVMENAEGDIVADVYEEGIDSTHYIFKKRIKQRFTKNSSGFAGYVARHGQMINVEEAYNDPRYYRGHDWMGLLTKSVISIPLKGSQGVLGVLQLVNKLQKPYFTARDEILLKNIASYASLACQHTCLKEKLRKMNYRCVGLEELLQIHLKPCPDDLRFLRYLPILKKSELPKGFFNFDWIITGKEEQASNYAVFMFTYLLADQYFDYLKLTEFILMVKKSYRDNPYHNFVHAFTVCHCMFNILHRNRDVFTNLQIFALMTATICHDSDHLAFTNNFLEMTNHWLSELYWESPLENHHYDVCKHIVTSCDFFSALKPHELAEVDSLLKNLILATDLVQYFRNKSQIAGLIRTSTFNIQNPDHRILLLSIMMTVCDVSGQCKPFYTAKKVTEGLYREFYTQGDIEKELGFRPLALMDREKTSTVPENQIQFLSLVCIPSVDVLVTILPNTEDLLKQCMELKDCWSNILEKKVVEIWKMDDCILQHKGKKRNKKVKLSSYS